MAPWLSICVWCCPQCCGRWRRCPVQCCKPGACGSCQVWLQRSSLASFQLWRASPIFSHWKVWARCGVHDMRSAFQKKTLWETWTYLKSSPRCSRWTSVFPMLWRKPTFLFFFLFFFFLGLKAIFVPGCDFQLNVPEIDFLDSFFQNNPSLAALWDGLVSWLERLSWKSSGWLESSSKRKIIQQIRGYSWIFYNYRLIAGWLYFTTKGTWRKHIREIISVENHEMPTSSYGISHFCCFGELQQNFPRSSTNSNWMIIFWWILSRPHETDWKMNGNDDDMCAKLLYMYIYIYIYVRRRKRKNC